MFRKYILPLLAVAGIGYGIYVAVQDLKVLMPASPVAEPPQAPYALFVAGAGIVEASTENISIGTHTAGIVSKLYVHFGSKVKKGDPLFTIDDRAQKAEVTLRQAAVKVAQAQLNSVKDQLSINEHLDKGLVSEETLINSRDAVKTAEAQLDQAQAQLQQSLTSLELLTVNAPVDGEVLQLKVHLGEFVPMGVTQSPLLMLGNVEPIHVRVDVDENDAWRVRPGARATGYLRGNREVKAELVFDSFEPYVIPKTSLTGDSTERVDTRVLQVIYSFKRGDLPIFVGQQMDIFIDASNSSPTRL